MLPIDPSTYSFDPIFMNGIIGMLVQKMKATKHPLLMWISESTPGIARIVNVILAAFSASLMALTYTTADDGSIAVTVSGITFSSVCTFLWTVAKNFGAQSVAGGALELYQDMRRRKENQEFDSPLNKTV